VPTGIVLTHTAGLTNEDKADTVNTTVVTAGQHIQLRTKPLGAITVAADDLVCTLEFVPA